MPAGSSNSFIDSSYGGSASFFGLMELPQDVIVEEDEGPSVNEIADVPQPVAPSLRKKQELAVKYQNQYQTNPFGKKLKEVSTKGHASNIEESALLNDLSLHERQQP